MTDDLHPFAEKFMHLMDKLRQLGSGATPLKEANISPALLPVLTSIASYPGCGIQVIATHLKLAAPTVSVSVRQLEEAGLISRQPDPQDGRAVQLFLTPAGQELYQRVYEFRCNKYGLLLSGLTPQERATLLTLFEQAINSTKTKE